MVNPGGHFLRRGLGMILAMVVIATPLGSMATTAGGQGPNERADEDAWRFRVYLDDREIGYHNFVLDRSEETRVLRSEANFEYRLMFVKLFHYAHENTETWNGDCLQSVRSRTDSNGQPYRVDGRLAQGRFQVTGSTGQANLPQCVMSFAYWNPVFLQQQRLLNTQTGEFVDVDVSPPVTEPLTVRGETRTAYRYRLEAGDLRLDLWYSADHQWLALESEVRGGRTLRYELL